MVGAGQWISRVLYVQWGKNMERPVLVGFSRPVYGNPEGAPRSANPTGSACRRPWLRSQGEFVRRIFAKNE